MKQRRSRERGKGTPLKKTIKKLQNFLVGCVNRQSACGCTDWGGRSRPTILAMHAIDFPVELAALTLHDVHVEVNHLVAAANFGPGQ